MIFTVKVAFNKNLFNKGEVNDRVLYDFLSNDSNIHRGDTVVVETKYGLCLAEVYRVVRGISANATKWVASKVDKEGLETNKHRYDRLIELKKQMAAREAELTKGLNMIKFLSKNDMEMKYLYEEFVQLSKDLELDEEVKPRYEI